MASQNPSPYAEDIYHPNSIENQDPGIPHLPTQPHNRLYALIIGINDYTTVGKLAGAVNDAQAMETFLKAHLNVPQDRIRHLFDHAASRHNIIDTFIHLSEETKIEMNDPILIYYAGHGCSLPPPENWEAGGAKRNIQGICSVDCGEKVQTDDPAELIHAIPDRTIGSLLDLICEKKGSNITVIFDCCHSSSGTRIGQHGTNVRGVELHHKLPVDLDQELIVGAHSRATTNFGRQGLGSHVLVAASREDEEALEVCVNDIVRGQFTVALLELLRKEGRMETLTYTDILKHIRKIQKQNPRIEGIYRDRILFSLIEPVHRHSFYSVRLNADAEKNTLILYAGSVQGITSGAQLTLYKDNDSVLNSDPLGTVVVSTVESTTSTLSIPEGTSDTHLKKSGIAILSGRGKGQALAIKASYGQLMPPTFLGEMECMENQCIISLVNEDAELEMQLDANGKLVFNILDSDHVINTPEFCRVYHAVELNKVSHILPAGSDFFWHLRRNHPHPVIDGIEVEFLELHKIRDDYGYYTYAPKTGENLLKEKAIKLGVGSVRRPYGIKITNHSEFDLFPAAFYFDHSDWMEYYHPGTAGKFKADPPLRKRGGTLTIGYGCGGSPPISFMLNREGQDLDVGILKIFFSTKAVDLRFIAQDSPFTSSTDNRKPHARDEKAWVSLQYPIIQKQV